MVVKVTSPVRIDISGGWPDSDPYRKDFGGAVLCGAIKFSFLAFYFYFNDIWRAPKYLKIYRLNKI